MMKYFKFFAFLIISALVVSCSDSESKSKKEKRNVREGYIYTISRGNVSVVLNESKDTIRFERKMVANRKQMAILHPCDGVEFEYKNDSIYVHPRPVQSFYFCEMENGEETGRVLYFDRNRRVYGIGFPENYHFIKWERNYGHLSIKYVIVNSADNKDYEEKVWNLQLRSVTKDQVRCIDGDTHEEFIFKRVSHKDGAKRFKREIIKQKRHASRNA